MIFIFFVWVVSYPITSTILTSIFSHQGISLTYYTGSNGERSFSDASTVILLARAKHEINARSG